MERENRIDHITAFTNRNRTITHIHYKNGKVRALTQNDNIPMTALKIMLEGKYTAKYTNTGKVETYR